MFDYHQGNQLLMKPMETAKNNVERQRCPSCESREIVPFGQVSLIQAALPKGIEPVRHLIRCNRCGSTGVKCVPHADFLRQYYNTYATATNKNLDRHRNGQWEKRIVLKSIRRIAKEIGRGRVLDIGCGDGTLLAALPSVMDKFGVDISEEACDRVREKGFQALCDSFLSVSFPFKFDLIIALDVLEHLPNPREAVHHITRMLAPNGYLVIQTGNADCLTARILRENWYYTAIFGHLCVLTPSALREITALEGLSEISFLTGMRIQTDWKTRIQRTCRACGFHAYRKLYGMFKPFAEKYSFLYKLNQHSPPPARNRDHMTYIGRKL